MDNKAQLRGSVLLLLGSVIWGAAFAAQRAGMDHVGPFTFSGIRMLLAAATLSILIPFVEKNQRTDRARRKSEWVNQRKAGVLCGIFLFFATSLQQMGLVYTSAGKAGFITALYVVLVPMAGWIVFRKNPGKIIWIGVGIAVMALYLLCVPSDGFWLESGDLLVLGCAVCFTFQILCIDRYAGSVSGLRLARDEFLITGGLSMMIALVKETIILEEIHRAVIPILYSGIMSGAVGYTLQVFGQRDTNPAVASLLMCLEAVFAVLTGVILLGETMTEREITGCCLMLTAVILAQLSPVIMLYKRKKYQQ